MRKGKDSLKRMLTVEKNLPEITLKAIGLSVILTVILAAANAYLGLKVGLTVSASIPAAVISMACLRLFKSHNILENNIVQTAASAGEALTAGIIFTIPGLIVISFWSHFLYYQIMIIAALGGILGVLFSVPLRRVLLADKTLPFPEGTAIGHVLKASQTKSFGAGKLISAGVIGAVIQIFQSGFKILSDSAQFWFVSGQWIIGAGFGFNPALLGAGYIIGTNISLCILVGIFLGWILGLPIIALAYGIPNLQGGYHVAMALWDQYLRYIGLGVMMVGGGWAILMLVKPMLKGLTHSFKLLMVRKAHGVEALSKQERDLPINWVGWSILIIMLIIAWVLYHLTSGWLDLSTSMVWGFTGINVFYILIGGFVFSSICAYFAGLVGSSANPLSSLSLIALMISATICVLILKDYLSTQTTHSIYAAGIVIIITAFVSAAAAISNDTIQDLKTGQMVGATPWKQQIMLILGVIISSLVIPGVLQLLFDAYGMAGVMPRPDMDQTQMLLAPQASLMAIVVQGVFSADINIILIVIGGIIAIAAIVADYWLSQYGYRVPVLALGLGIYLPISSSSPLVLGGLLGYWIRRTLMMRRHNVVENSMDHSSNIGLLMASGLVAGAAITGVLLAVPFVIKGSSDALRLMPNSWVYTPQLLSIIVTSLLFIWFRSQVLTAEPT